MPRPPPPATALMMTGYPISLANLSGLLLVLGRTVAAGKHRDARLLHGPPGAGLVAHQLDDVRVGTDESNVAGLAHLGEVRALRQKPVTRMNRIGARDLGGADDGRDVQIAVGASGRPDTDVFVRKTYVQRVLVRLRVDRDGPDAELAAGDDHAQRDFAPVRYQNLLEHVFMDR